MAGMAERCCCHQSTVIVSAMMCHMAEQCNPAAETFTDCQLLYEWYLMFFIQLNN